MRRRARPRREVARARLGALAVAQVLDLVVEARGADVLHRVVAGRARGVAQAEQRRELEPPLGEDAPQRDAPPLAHVLRQLEVRARGGTVREGDRAPELVPDARARRERHPEADGAPVAAAVAHLERSQSTGTRALFDLPAGRPACLLACS